MCSLAGFTGVELRWACGCSTVWLCGCSDRRILVESKKFGVLNDRKLRSGKVTKLKEQCQCKQEGYLSNSADIGSQQNGRFHEGPCSKMCPFFLGS